MVFLLQTNPNLILGFVPESIGLLIFGVTLIGVTVGLRWALKKGVTHEDVKVDKTTGTARS
ncbi:MAG TPA: hypothetical protein PKM58_06405 [Pyrinomonadaceae bacterium]|nr:hypothetical protein [Pyrinomonadaceae bacterium]HNU07177.1 hypothetical protein [Pyrinomonadaceae bacterium]